MKQRNAITSGALAECRNNGVNNGCSRGQRQAGGEPEGCTLMFKIAFSNCGRMSAENTTKTLPVA